MSALDSVFNDKQGRELLFSAGVEVGRVRGREEFAQMLRFLSLFALCWSRFKGVTYEQEMAFRPAAVCGVVACEQSAMGRFDSLVGRQALVVCWLVAFQREGCGRYCEDSGRL